MMTVDDLILTLQDYVRHSEDDDPELQEVVIESPDGTYRIAGVSRTLVSIDMQEPKPSVALFVQTED